MRTKKYKVVVKEVFSENYKSDEVQLHNLKKLVFYASTNPDKLDDIGAYLVEKMNRRVRKGYDGHLTTCLSIFMELIRTCETHLPLFGHHVVSALRLVFTQRPTVTVKALQTFRTYLEHVGHFTHFDWEFFVDFLVHQLVARELHRAAALETLACFVEHTQDFDAFTGRFVLTASDQPDDLAHNVLWSALGVLRGTGNEKDKQGAPAAATPAASVPENGNNNNLNDANGSKDTKEASEAAATELLRAMGRRANGVSIRPILAILLRFYKQLNLWLTQPEVAIRSICAMADAHGREGVLLLVEELRAQENVKIKSSVLNGAKYLLEGGADGISLSGVSATGSSFVGGGVSSVELRSMVGLLEALEALLQYIGKEHELEEQLCSCVRALVQRTHAAEQWQALFSILRAARDASQPEVQGILLRCAVDLAKTLQPRGLRKRPQKAGVSVSSAKGKEEEDADALGENADDEDAGKEWQLGKDIVRCCAKIAHSGSLSSKASALFVVGRVLQLARPGPALHALAAEAVYRSFVSAHSDFGYCEAAATVLRGLETRVLLGLLAAWSEQKTDDKVFATDALEVSIAALSASKKEAVRTYARDLISRANKQAGTVEAKIVASGNVELAPVSVSSVTFSESSSELGRLDTRHLASLFSQEEATPFWTPLAEEPFTLNEEEAKNAKNGEATAAADPVAVAALFPSEPVVPVAVAASDAPALTIDDLEKIFLEDAASQHASRSRIPKFNEGFSATKSKIAVQDSSRKQVEEALFADLESLIKDGIITDVEVESPLKDVLFAK